jgi:uncharacterized cupin superfamily protein
MSSASARGPRGHQLQNDTDEPIGVLILSTKARLDAVVHADSDKVGIWLDDEGPGRFFRLSSKVDYWDGES